MAEEKKHNINPKIENFIKGLALILIAIILAINVGKVARTFAFIPLYLFGASSYLIYALLVASGLYRIIRGKKIKISKFNFFIGGLLVFFALFFLISVVYVDFSNQTIVDDFNGQLSTYYEQRIINVFDKSTNWQGGLVGISFAVIIQNKSIAIFIGIALLLLGAIVISLPWVLRAIKNKKPKAKTSKEEKKEEAKPVAPIENPVIAREPIEIKPGYESDQTPFINENSGFVKPSISLDENFAGRNNAVPVSNRNNEEFVPLTFSKQRKPEPVYNPSLIEESKEEISPLDDLQEDVNLIEARPEEVAPIVEEIRIDESLVRIQPDFVEPVEVVEKPEPVLQAAPPAPKKKVRVNFIPPSSDLLMTYETQEAQDMNESVANTRVEAINQILTNFKIGARCTGYKIGPSITRFNIEYDPNVTMKNVERLVDDISMRLGGVTARFTPIVAGESYSGLEVPNAKITTVSFKEVFDSLPDVKKHPLSVAFGKDISGNVIQADFDEFPHLLVAGTTGSGKSIYIHSIIATLIMRVSPDDLKIVLVDPKKVEMTKYRDMPHLLCPIITEAEKAKVMLSKLVEEMNKRYETFGNNGEVSNIKQYNEWAKENGADPMPFIIVVLDEYADLVDTCKEISQPVVSIAQKARAAGIHLLISTQRPSTNVITGVIKGNLPTHVALMTSNYTDSMTIIGEGGAETLLGKGDMLVQSPLVSRVGVTRLQGCFVQNKEISHVVGYLKEHYETVYDENFLDLVDHSKDVATQMIASGEIEKEADAAEEEKYQSIKEWVLTQKFVSMSKIQRECFVGFNRAGRFFKRLQAEGVVSTEIDGNSKGCKVLGVGYDDDNSDPDNYVNSNEMIS